MILTDTSPLYAVADQDDKWHARLHAFLETRRRQLVVPMTVLPEVCYLIGAYLGAAAEVSFVRSIFGGEVRVEPPDEGRSRTNRGGHGSLSGRPSRIRGCVGRGDRRTVEDPRDPHDRSPPFFARPSSPLRRVHAKTVAASRTETDAMGKRVSPLDRFQSKKSEDRHLEQEPAVVEPPNVGGAVGPFLIADRHFQDL